MDKARILEADWSTLNRKKHIERLIELLTCPLVKDFQKMVPSQTWTVYWATHSLALLEQNKTITDLTKDVIRFIGECAHPDGGYGGGPGQIAHVATSFAAVNALLTVSGEEALDSIDRVNLVRFLHRMKQPDGSYTIHDDGEVDSRSTYCALAMLFSLNIHDSILLENVADWLLSCQTYEGGFGSVPGSEAHGGYTFCCVASLYLLNQLHRADLNALLRWLTNKQLTHEGGFCGRSNKLVDSCYSYWQGAVFPILHPFLPSFSYGNCQNDLRMTPLSTFVDDGKVISNSSKKSNHRRLKKQDDQTKQDNQEGGEDEQRKPFVISETLRKLLGGWLFDGSALQDYLFNQCQSKHGLLKDKPDTVPDYYHTCYALSGLSISQHEPSGHIFDLGSQQINLVASIHPVFNLTIDRLEYCIQYFKNKKIETFVEDGSPQEERI